jgi:Glyoxalase-like domain
MLPWHAPDQAGRGRRWWRGGWPGKTDAKTTKNRLHLDLSPDPGEQEAEIERILALGARRVDIGQTGAESWTVLADPEGNEFCVVRPKRTLIDYLSFVG